MENFHPNFHPFLLRWNIVGCRFGDLREFGDLRSWVAVGDGVSFRSE